MTTRIHRFDPKETTSVSELEKFDIYIDDGIWDLRSIRLFFDLTIQDPAGNIPSDCSPPQHLDCFIDSLVVYVDDIEVQHLKRYNQYARLMSTYSNRPSSSSSFLGNNIFNNFNRYLNFPCCIDRFHGLLGSDVIMAGKLRIQIFTAPNSVLIRGSASYNYLMSNCHLLIKSSNKMNPRFKSRIEYESYMTMGQYNETFNQQTNMYCSSRKLSHVLGTFLTHDYDRAVSEFPVCGSSRYFVHGSGDYDTHDTLGITVNFAVKNLNISDRYVHYASCPDVISMLSDHLTDSSLYPIQLLNDGSVIHHSLPNLLANKWACGLPLDIDNQDGRALDISFKSHGSIQPNHSLIFVVIKSLLERSDSGNYNMKL